MRKTFSALLCIIVTVMMVIAPAVANAEETVAKVKFNVTEAADGTLEMDVIVSDAKIQAFQSSIRYDKNVLTPVNAENEKAEAFEDFIVRNEKTELFREIGMKHDADKGLFGFAFYIFPGTRDESIVNDRYIADSDGINICTFRFKRIAEGDCGFEVALPDDEKPYDASITEGIIITGDDISDTIEVTFNINGAEEKQSISAVTTDTDVCVPKTSEERKSDVICLMVDRSMTVTYGKKQPIDEENPLVVPYIKEDRTLVPLRYISEALGAQVLWETGWNGCIIEKDGKKIEITFGSAEFRVNGETVTYDAPIEVVHDRTMIPVRFISEELGCDVYWNELNRAIVISPADTPWEEDRSVEITALNEMMLTIVGLL